MDYVIVDVIWVNMPVLTSEDKALISLRFYELKRVGLLIA